MEDYYNQQYDSRIEERLSDEALFGDYLQEPSVKLQIETYTSTLRSVGICEEQIELALQSYLPHLIPPGTKGIVRGRKLEQIVQDTILEMKLGPEYEVVFEKDIRKQKWTLTDESPDFYIKKGDSILIGMVQYDLWSGGAQANRASKYVFYPRTGQKKLVSVVCAKPPKMGGKRRKLFQHGMDFKTLCYPRGLASIVDDFFQEKSFINSDGEEEFII